MTGKRYEHRKQIKSVRWLIFWVVIAQLAAQTALSAYLSFAENPPHEYIRIAIIEIISIGVPIAVYGHSLRRGFKTTDARKELRLKSCSAGLLLISAILGASGQFIMVALNIPVNFYMSQVLNEELSDAIPVAMSAAELVMGTVGVVIVPAVLEELWLRGIVFSAYNNSSTRAAIIFTTLVFALMHLRLGELMGFLFMGFMLTVVLLRTDSLYATIVYHMSSNLAALIFGYVLSGVLDRLWVIFAVSTVIFIAALIVLIKKGKGVKRTANVKASKIIWGSVMSLPIILSVLITALGYFVVD